ncbi:hypothetical protein [Actinocorallia longicatena]|uniref:Uncharacterized protein n=1 Tax=Actinocorallia longicatena TaxID=111803 RepID=A0ABP6PZ91_9ACTN
MTPPTLSITREILRVYDQRFLDVEPPVRRKLAVATKSMLDGLLTDDVRRGLAEPHRLRAFCIENDLHDELERLIADEAAGRREGAVVVGGRVYAVYPYLRGVPRQDADITAEVGVDHRLDALAWDKTGRLKVKGAAGIARVEARGPAVTLILAAGEAEHRFPVTPADGGFEALVEIPPGGPWNFRVEVSVLGVTRTAPFGSVRHADFKEPKMREGFTLRLDGCLEVASEGSAAPAGKRRFWEFRRASQG